MGIGADGAGDFFGDGEETVGYEDVSSTLWPRVGGREWWPREDTGARDTRKAALKKTPEPQKKKTNATDERAATINQMAASVATMVQAYAETKKNVSINAAWASVLAQKLDPLDQEDQEDIRIEVDNLVYKRVRAARQRKASEM